MVLKMNFMKRNFALSFAAVAAVALLSVACDKNPDAVTVQPEYSVIFAYGVDYSHMSTEDTPKFYELRDLASSKIRAAGKEIFLKDSELAFNLQYVCTYTFKGEGKDEAEALAKADESARALFESRLDKVAEEAVKILNALCEKRLEYADQIKNYEEKYKMIITPGFIISRKSKSLSEQDVTIRDIDFTDARFEVRGGQNYSPEMKLDSGFGFSKFR